MAAAVLALLLEQSHFAPFVEHLSFPLEDGVSELRNEVCLLGRLGLLLLESLGEGLFQLGVLPHLVQSVSLSLTHRLQHLLLLLDHRLLLLQSGLHDVHGLPEGHQVLLVVLFTLLGSHLLLVGACVGHLLYLE